MTELQKMGKKAKEAAEKLACAGNLKDKALLAMAAAIEEKEEEIISNRILPLSMDWVSYKSA